MSTDGEERGKSGNGAKSSNGGKNGNGDHGGHGGEGVTVAALLEQLRRGELPAGAVTIYEERNRIFTVALADGTVANVKAFRPPRGLNRLVYGWLRASKARRSQLHALRLREMGIGTPRPLGVVETYRAAHLLDRSYYVSEQLEGWGDLRYWERMPDRDALVEALGREMARFFREGVLFKDFSPGNVLVRQLGDGGYEFAYIDLNRMAFDVPQRGLWRMFRGINVLPEETARIARATARAASWDVASTEARALRVLRRFLRSKELRRSLKRLLGLARR